MASAGRLTPVTSADTRTLAILLTLMVATARGWPNYPLYDYPWYDYPEEEEIPRDCEFFVAIIEQELASRNLTRNDELASRNLTRNDESACRVIARTMVCFQNDYCGHYGRCCLNTVPVEPPHPDMVCRYEAGGELYMLERCPERWEDSAVRRMCERQDAAASAEPFAALPVTSRVTNRTYSNYYCAVCHDDSQQPAFWTPAVKCEKQSEGSSLHWFSDINLPVLNKTFIWDNLVRRDDGQWGVYTENVNDTKFYKCYLTFQPNEVPITSCEGVHFCNVNMPNIEETLCTAFDEIETQISHNCTSGPCELCAISPCLHTDSPPLYLPPPPPIFTSLYVLDIRDVSGSGAVGDVSLCSQWQVWSPFRGGQCLDVRCDIPGSRLEGGRCIPPPLPPGEDSLTPPLAVNSTETVSSDQSRAHFVTCPKLHLNASDYELADNGSVFVPQHDRSFEHDEYELRSGGQLVVCVTEATDQPDSKFGIVIAYIATICLAVSVLCLLLHIGAFLVGALNRNLPGMCVTSLAVCLLIGYFCLLVSETQEQGTSGCRQIAIVTLAALEASMFWTNVMAFDVFMALRRASSELQVTRGRRLRRFALYTLYVWVLTAVVVAAAVLADQMPAVPPPYRPGFGEPLCWFSRRRPLAIFFASPLAVTMATNATLYAAIARLIRRMGSASANAAQQPRKHLRLFSRLAVMMGLSWIVGLLAGLLDFQPLYYVFIMLYTLQGVFIFAAFTVTRSARAWLRRLAAGCCSVLCGALCRRRRPDAFNSSRTAQSRDTGRDGTKLRWSNWRSSGVTRSTKTTQV